LDVAIRARAEFEYTWNGFWASPPGVARQAFNNGDHVFQYEIDILNHEAITRAMVGSSTRIAKLDPSAVLNAVCREGWELVNGSFVFVQAEGGLRETLLGCYLLKRCEENRETETEEQLARRLGWSPTAFDPAANGAVSCPECAAVFADLEAYTAHYRSMHPTVFAS
jgi:hypothetical protein